MALAIRIIGWQAKCSQRWEDASNNHDSHDRFKNMIMDNWFTDLLFDYGFFRETIMKMRATSRYDSHVEIMNFFGFLRTPEGLEQLRKCPTTGTVIEISTDCISTGKSN